MISQHERLPEFVYHPDPVSTGSAEASDEVCVCCSRARGYVYRYSVHCEEDLDGRVCLWCIADGSAAERYDAFFGAAPGAKGISMEVIDTICRRTPGFAAWQEDRWMFHCGDGAAFKELRGNEQAIEYLRAGLVEDAWPAETIEQYLAALDRDGQPTAYLFQCRSCGMNLAYSDFT